MIKVILVKASENDNISCSSCGSRSLEHETETYTVVSIERNSCTTNTVFCEECKASLKSQLGV